jgi:uncharacterized protein (DUF488 family)
MLGELEHGSEDDLPDEQPAGSYYYDDAHGYEVYKPDGPLTIWTIGHSTRDLTEFLDLLRNSDIEVLADVRSYPGSRKFPHFNKESLEISLPEQGIEYIHVRQLGGRRKAKPDSKNTVWRNEAFRGYADYMETDEFREGIAELVRLAKESRTAIMCSEAVWWRCHRSLISDYLKAAGMTVLHILGPDKVVEHPYTSAASIVNGNLSYEERT